MTWYSRFWSQICQSGRQWYATEVWKVIIQRSTPPQSRFLFRNTEAIKNEYYTTECNFHMNAFVTKTRFCSRGITKHHKCSFPFCFPFRIFLPTSYHTFLYSLTEITIFFTWNIKRSSLETGQRKVQKSQILSFCDYRMNGQFTCSQLWHRSRKAFGVQMVMHNSTYAILKNSGVTPTPQTRGI